MAMQTGDDAKGSLPPGEGYLWEAGHPTEEDLEAFAVQKGWTIEKTREYFKVPSGFATLGDYQQSLRSRP